MEPQERKFRVLRAKRFATKTCLLAGQTIPPGAFLFYNFSENIDLNERIGDKFNMFGAGKIFLISLPKNRKKSEILKSAGIPPTYDEAAGEKWDFRFINPPQIYYSRYSGVNGRKSNLPNVELREEIRVQGIKNLWKVQIFYGGIF